MIQINLYCLEELNPDIPDGKTVLPINDVEIWQQCAGITPVYTTLAGVLGDDDVLTTLMASDNAVEYMIRSTEWATPQPLVPTMTSNTEPSGVASASNEGNTNVKAFKAFDGNDSTLWNTNTYSASNAWLKYEFEEDTICSSAYLYLNDANALASEYKIQGSNNDTDWSDLYSGTFVVSSGSSNKVSFNNSTAYKYIRIYFLTGNISGPYSGLTTLQFYSTAITASESAMRIIGSVDYAADTLLADSTWREAICNSDYFEYILNAKVPIMTSNTAPEGQCFGSANISNYEQYKAFDGNMTASPWGTSSITNQYIGYKFVNDLRIFKADIVFTQGKQYTIQASIDNSTYTTLYSGTTPSDNATVSINFNNDTDYLYYRLYISNTWRNASGFNITVRGLQFYGRRPGGVQTWLHKAGITNKNYTSLIEVLEDTETLTTLMNSEEAVDYLATCKGWIITDNYEGLVPIMTSNTEPEGECIGNGSFHANWEAFTQNQSNYSQHPIGAIGYIGYKFTEPTIINEVSFKVSHNGTGTLTRTFKFQTSTDGNTWIDLAQVSGTVTSGATEYTMSTTSLYNNLYWRITSTEGMSGFTYLYRFVQFYSKVGITTNSNAMTAIGNSNYASDTLLADTDWLNGICNSIYMESVLNVSIPAMTSATTPSGEVTSNYDNAGYPNYADWKAFDGNISTYTFKENATDYEYGSIEYTFPDNVTVKKAVITYGYHTDNMTTVHTETNKIQAYINNEWVDVVSFPYATAVINTNNTVTLYMENFVAKTNKYRLRLPTKYLSTYTLYIPDDIAEAQFYARKDV